MERLLGWLDPAGRPVLVQRPDAETAPAPPGWGLPEPRPRARDLGLAPGVFPPGPLNAITDVAGVRVGHTTLVAATTSAPASPPSCPTAATSSRRRSGAVFVGNAFGKLAGSTQVQELGAIETPIVLTNTLAVGRPSRPSCGWTLAQPATRTCAR